MLGMMVPNGRSYDMASKDAWNAVHLQCEELMRMEVFPNFAQGRGNCLRPWIMILHIPRCVTAKSQKGWCQCNKMISYSPRLMVVSVCWANSTSWLIGEYISRYVHQGGATHFSIAKTFFLCGGWFITRDCLITTWRYIASCQVHFAVRGSKFGYSNYTEMFRCVEQKWMQTITDILDIELVH